MCQRVYACVSRVVCVRVSIFDWSACDCVCCSLEGSRRVQTDYEERRQKALSSVDFTGREFGL